MNIVKLTEDLLDKSVLLNKRELPFKFQVFPGHEKIMLLVGDNCSGKSLLVQCLASWGHHHYKIAPITVSIRERAGAGLSDMGGMRRAFMFGDESEQSTGATSIGVLKGAFNTAHSRDKDKLSALIMLDEPDLGLSEGFAAAMGTHLGQEALKLPESACGLVIVTHSRRLARSLATAIGQNPTFVLAHLKTNSTRRIKSCAHWLEAEDPDHSVEELLAMPDKGHGYRKTVWDLLAKGKKKNS